MFTVTVTIVEFSDVAWMAGSQFSFMLSPADADNVAFGVHDMTRERSLMLDMRLCSVQYTHQQFSTGGLLNLHEVHGANACIARYSGTSRSSVTQYA